MEIFISGKTVFILRRGPGRPRRMQKNNNNENLLFHNAQYQHAPYSIMTVINWFDPLKVEFVSSEMPNRATTNRAL